MRLFWACTHVTLRETELPLLLRAGLEVIPEDPNETFLAVAELQDYEDERVHPAAGVWKRTCTVDRTELDFIRRSNLVLRRGRLTTAEVELFNRWIDVIYVATCLDTAVAVSRWFRGTVVYRLFGINDRLGDFRADAQRFPEADLKRLVLSPIFNSVAELPEAKRFARTAVVHGYRDGLSGRWMGFEGTRHGGVVAHMCTEGSESARSVERLLPYARRRFTWLLGKNDQAAVPAEIRRAFQVTGTLAREAFLEAFCGLRLLLHPYDNPYHNHYTNLESITLGIPTLVLAENPLARENNLATLAPEERLDLGVFGAVAEMAEFAERHFDDRRRLEAIAHNQKRLLAPFSLGAVSREIAAFVEVLADEQRAAGSVKLGEASTAFLSKSTMERLALQRRFIEDGGVLVLNELTPHALDGVGAPRLVPGADPRLLPVGFSGAVYASGRHEFSFHVDGAGRISLCVELWRHGTRTMTRFLTVDVDHEAVEVGIMLAAPAGIVFYACASGADALTLESAFHRLDPTQVIREDDIRCARQENSCANQRLFFTRLNPLLPGDAGYGAYGLWVRNGESRQLILPSRGRRETVPMSVSAALFAKRPASVALTLECWIENEIAASRQERVSIGPGTTRIETQITEAPETFAPVVYVASEDGDIEVEDIEVSGIVLTPHAAHAAASALRFHGQFDPPVDKVLYERYFRDSKRPGVFVEAGACDGVTESSCLFFSESLGWTGVNVEPTPYFFEKLTHNRPRDVNLNIALSSLNGRQTFTHAIHPYWGRHFGNGSLSHVDRHKTELADAGCSFETFEVVTRRFADIVVELGIARIDLMVLDVEGHELEALSGMIDSPVLPRILCIEYTQVGLDELQAPLARLGYTFDGISHSNALWRR